MNTDPWQSELRRSIKKVDELCRVLEIPCCSDRTDYPLLVPRPFVDLMEQRNLNDPLLLQVLPQAEENQTAPNFSKDPLGEIADTEGDIDSNKYVTLNKYTGRTLLLVSHECAVHCRFCFRRHFPKAPTRGDGRRQTADGSKFCRLPSALQEEVILSGGDPLMLDDATLDRLLQSILSVKHVRRIRIHSRLPIVLPCRLTAKLAEILTLPIPVYLVLHVNHPNELSEEFLERRELLVKPVVLAQTVLLRKVNDAAETLYRLFHRLIDARILPYYLHQLDKVEGATHFEVAPEEGLRILTELRQRLPGYAVPAYVREINGNTCKDIMGGM